MRNTVRAWLLNCLHFMFLLPNAPSLHAETLLDTMDQKPTNVRPQDVIDWVPFEALEKEDGRIELTLRMSVKGDWKVYTHNLKFASPPGYEIVQTTPPPTTRILDPISGQEVDVFSGGEFQLLLSGAPSWTGQQFPLDVTYVGCTNVICLFPYTHHLEAPFRKWLAVENSPNQLKDAATQQKDDPAEAQASSASSVPSQETPPAAPQTAPSLGSDAPLLRNPSPGDTPLSSSDFETQLAQKLRGGGLSFAVLLALVFAGGLLSNLTPCVYPMIPITLRLLSKQGESPYKSASYYAAGIVLTYSTLGLVAALSGGLFGSLLASKTFNLVFAGLMFTLGVSMLGFGDLSKLQMLGSRLGSGTPSHWNTFLMGAGAGLVAAPCTGPILAALLAYIAGKGDDVVSGVSLLFVYSLGFSLPYIALGGAAAHISKVKVSPRIQIATKLIFSSVMFALGLYYLRVPLYSFFMTLRPYWSSVAIFAGCAGILLTALWLGLPSLSANKLSTLIPTVILGGGIFALSQWATSNVSSKDEVKLYWYHDEAAALRASTLENKPVLIDMWAEWCEACKKLDATTFKHPDVMARLAKDFVLLKFDLTELDAQSEATQKKYEIQSLPTLILLPPKGEISGKKPITGYVDGPGLLQEIENFLSSTN